MAEFQNTIDLLGDEETARRIIRRTITEFYDDTVYKIGLYAFCQCEALKSVDAPGATLVDSSAFYGCTALTSANIPNATQIRADAFEGCSLLTSVNLRSATSIMGGVFNSCAKLTTVDLPSATKMQNAIFQSSGVKTLILRSEVACTLSNKNSFSSCPFDSSREGGTLLVPRALIETYQGATNWSVILSYPNNRTLALEDYTLDGTTSGTIDWAKLGG